MAASASAALPEFSPPFSKPFTASSKATLLQTIGGNKLTCTGDTGAGEITAPQAGTIRLTFTGCKSKKIPCNLPGIPPGTIITPTYAMTVGYLNKAKKEVGIDLTEPAGLPMLEVICGTALKIVVVGSVVGRITPVNKVVTPSETFTLKFTQSLGSPETEEPRSEPDRRARIHWGGPFERTGLSSVERLLFTEPVKLSA